jgi:CspA family cold shock protein
MGYAAPKMNSNKITQYSLDLIEMMRDEANFTALCVDISNQIESALESSGVTIDGNTPDRLKSFTEHLLEGARKDKDPDSSMQEEPELVVGNCETGELRWFDDVKGYGFIDRDAGGDIFVHATGLADVPWNKREPGTKVEFTIIEGRKGHQATNTKLKN